MSKRRTLPRLVKAEDLLRWANLLVAALQGEQLTDAEQIADKMTEFRSVRDYGTVGDGVADDATAIQEAINEAAPLKRTVVVPAGTYGIAAGLILKIGAHLRLEPGAVIKAIAAMPAMLRTEEAGYEDWHDGTNVSGGTWDGNSLAVKGIWLKFFKSFFLDRITVHAVTAEAFHIGSMSAPQNSYECYGTRLRSSRPDQQIAPGNSVGLYIENSNDNHWADCLFIGNKKGVKGTDSNSKYDRVHCWNHPGQQPMLTGFEISGFHNVFTQCQADVPAPYGFHLKQIGNCLIGCTILNNPAGATGGTDNVIVGVQVDAGVEFRAIACNFVGFDGASRIAVDFAGDLAQATIIGTYSRFVVAPAGDRFPRDTSQFPIALRIQGSASLTSDRAVISYGQWQIGQDSGGNTQRDFFFYTADLEETVLQITTTGTVAARRELAVLNPGGGVLLRSPNGSITKRLGIDNAGAIVLTDP